MLEQRYSSLKMKLHGLEAGKASHSVRGVAIFLVHSGATYKSAKIIRESPELRVNQPQSDMPAIHQQPLPDLLRSLQSGPEQLGLTEYRP